MNFVISSTELFNRLQLVSRVISSKNTLPILDNFLFQVKDKTLTITGSDLESTFITRINLENVEGEGDIAIEAKRPLDIIKEFAEQPLTFNIDLESLSVDVLSANGKFSLKGQNAAEYPQLPSLKKEKTSFPISPAVLLKGINNTIFATANDEMRPVMNGIFIDISGENLTFVSSDAHKLVRYKRKDNPSDIRSSFILPQKPANLLKTILPKGKDSVAIEFDDKNAVFTLSDFTLVSRLVEGNYPNYNSVIPTDNPNKMTIDRLSFYNTVKRVSIFSNQASNLVKLNITGNQLTVSAQDIDFSISAYERINCQYQGEEIEIGFKSVFLAEILSNLNSSDIILELSDPSRAGIFFPAEKEEETEDILMLLMPMMINS